MKQKKLECYVCVDLETTGLNPKTDKIIEVGAVRVENGVPVESFETFVNPACRLREQITELTGITDEALMGAPGIAEVLPDLLAFLREDLLLGHSVLFDYAFLKKAAVNSRIRFERMGMDTLKIARHFLPELPSRSLDFLCGHYGIPHKAHRALADAEATCRLYDKLWEAFGEQEENAVFAPAALLYQAKRETPATSAQKERLYKLIVRHKIEVEYDLDKLTRSEASRYTDRILAKYGR